MNTATSVVMTEMLSPFDQSVPRTAATEAGGNAADFAAPMHGQIAVGHRAGETTRRLVMTAPPLSFRTQNLGKRSRGRNRTPVFIGNSAARGKNRPGLATGRVDSGNGRHSDSIPSKSRRISDIGVEPVLTSQLSVRRREAATGLAENCESFSGEFLMAEAEGGGVGCGAQAVCGRPLVPRPSSLRTQGECHPW